MSHFNSTVSLSEVKKQPEVSPLSHSEPEVPKCRNYLTVSVYISFMALGMAASIVGPTFLHLTYVLDTDLQTLAVSYTTGAIGYLLGALVCGFLADVVNSELQFTLTTSTIGLAVIACPWAPNVYVYYLLDSLKAFSCGYMDALGQSYIIYLWGGHRFKEPMMQAMHGIWSVGATIGPFLLIPFLPPLPGDTMTTDSDNNTTTATPIENGTATVQYSDGSTEFEGAMSLRFCYALIGGFVFIMCGSFLVAFFVLGPSCVKRRGKTAKTESAEGISNTKAFVVILMSLQFAFFAAYAWLEIIPGGYIATLVLKGLGWDVKQAPLITSVFWGFHGIGRIAAVPISYFVSPSAMTLFDLIGTTAGFLLMLFALTTTESLLWFSVALTGFSISSIFASMILWTSTHITITGFVGAVFLVGSSFGSMIGGALTGFLFQQYTHMWVIYLSLIACFVEIVLYFVLHLFVKIYKRGEPARNTEVAQKAEESHLMT